MTLLLACALLIGACDNDEEPRAAPSPDPTPAESPAPTPTSAESCANQSAAVTDAGLRVGGTLAGDVDGDAAPDETFIVQDETAPAGCKAFLVVKTATRMYSLPIWEMGAEGGLPAPILNSIVAIDPRAGSEVVVTEAAGASTQFVGVFTIDPAAGLVRVEAQAGEDALWEGAQDGLFPIGGSVGHIEAVDCSGGGVVVSSAVPAEGAEAIEQALYQVTRHFMTFSGSVLTPASTDEQSTSAEQLSARFPEYAASPFGSCG
jgi:hypothetical protein